MGVLDQVLEHYRLTPEDIEPRWKKKAQQKEVKEEQRRLKKEQERLQTETSSSQMPQSAMGLPDQATRAKVNGKFLKNGINRVNTHNADSSLGIGGESSKPEPTEQQSNQENVKLAAAGGSQSQGLVVDANSVDNRHYEATDARQIREMSLHQDCHHSEKLVKSSMEANGVYLTAVTGLTATVGLLFVLWRARKRATNRNEGEGNKSGSKKHCRLHARDWQ